MDEPVISKFYVFYYIKGIIGGIVALAFTGYMVHLSVSGKLPSAADAYFWPVFSLGMLAVYYYFFSKAWKRITITPTEIIVDDPVFKKQIKILYAGITSISTSRLRSNSRFGYISEQHFFIEFSGDQSFTINEGRYDNYDQLKMAIYSYKYGPGHGRERYRARRNNR